VPLTVHEYEIVADRIGPDGAFSPDHHTVDCV
jgi:hypothetical protein